MSAQDMVLWPILNFDTCINVIYSIKWNKFKHMRIICDRCADGDSRKIDNIKNIDLCRRCYEWYCKQILPETSYDNNWKISRPAYIHSRCNMTQISGMMCRNLSIWVATTTYHKTMNICESCTKRLFR
jgi:hypothetical protein